MANTRVSVLSVLWEFRQGALPEEIVTSLPTLALADVYALAAWYLRHRDALDCWLDEDAAESDRLCDKHWSRPENAALRERLLARWNALQRERAEMPGQAV